MSETWKANLKAAQASAQLRKESLERVREGFTAIPGPDPAELLDGQPRGLKSMKALYMLNMAELPNIENNIDVLETCIQTLDQAIEMVDAGRDDDARGLEAALPDLLKQLIPPLARR